jgi:hypothetical protein
MPAQAGGTGWEHVGPLVFRRFVRERPERQVACDLTLPLQHEAPRVCRLADHRGVEAPLLEDAPRFRFTTRLQRHEHALLTFREHEFVGAHARLAGGDRVDVDLDARAALGGHLDGRRGEAGGAHVLDADDGVGLHKFEAGLDEELLEEGVADLHGGAALLSVVAELGGRHGRAVDAVAAGLGPDIDDGAPRSSGGGGEDTVLAGHTYAHGVDEDVAVVTRVEIRLAAQGRHADAVAVTADAANHPVDETTGLRVGGIAEAERVHQRHGPGAHREHVAHDAADPGGGPLVGLDVGGVVVALHLEDAGEALADIDDPGVLARPVDDVGSLGGQLGEVRPARLVGAVLRPHHREDAQFRHVGSPPELLEYRCVLFLREAELEGLRFGRFCEMRMGHGGRALSGVGALVTEGRTPLTDVGKKAQIPAGEAPWIVANTVEILTFSSPGGH